jgi:hypothetical protein
VVGFRAESLDGMPRNQWTTCSGMTGRLGPEYALSRFESEYIHHAVEMRHDVLTLYKITYGDIERRVKELESVKK